MQAGEKLALKDTTKGDVIVKLVPLIDNFEAAKNAIKVQSDAEQKIVDSYQVRAACLHLHNRDCPNSQCCCCCCCCTALQLCMLCVATAPGDWWICLPCLNAALLLGLLAALPFHSNAGIMYDMIRAPAASGYSALRSASAHHSMHQSLCLCALHVIATSVHMVLINTGCGCSVYLMQSSIKSACDCIFHPKSVS